jgi:general secretion pathway protein A
MIKSNNRISVQGINHAPPNINSDWDSNYANDAERALLGHFGLNEQPFGVTPDPRFLYLGSQHREALAALTYGTDANRGFLTLIAEPGMGKTSLLFQYLGGLRNKARTAYLFQTDGNSRDLMYYLLADLGVNGAGKDLPEMRSILNDILMQDMKVNRRFVLVIDEAQNLNEETLESVRLLSNFERPWMKLMQIVLAGQPQLGARLARPSMAQFRQRVSFAIRVKPFSPEEVNAYVDHRLWVAGYQGPSLFSVGARTLLAEQSKGIPRIINNICFCAMTFAWTSKTKVIDREMMRDILADLDLGSPSDAGNTSPSSAGEVRQIVPPPIHTPTLTVADRRSLGLAAKLCILFLVALLLGWAGIHFNVTRRLGFSVDDITAAIRGTVVPDPPALIAPNQSSSGPNAEVPTGIDSSNEPQSVRTQFDQSRQGSN